MYYPRICLSSSVDVRKLTRLLCPNRAIPRKGCCGGEPGDTHSSLSYRSSSSTSPNDTNPPRDRRECLSFAPSHRLDSHGVHPRIFSVQHATSSAIARYQRVQPALRSPHPLLEVAMQVSNLRLEIRGVPIHDRIHEGDLEFRTLSSNGHSYHDNRSTWRRVTSNEIALNFRLRTIVGQCFQDKVTGWRQ